MKQSLPLYVSETEHVVAMQCNSSGLEGVGGLESTTKGAEAATTEKITSLRVISNHLC